MIRDAFLERNWLTADGEADIRGAKILDVQPGEDLTEVPLEEQGLDVEIQLVLKISVQIGVGILEEVAGEAPGFVEGTNTHHQAFTARELQVEEEVEAIGPFRDATVVDSGDAVHTAIEGL